MIEKKVDLPELDGDTIILKLQGFIKKFGKEIGIGLGAISLVVAGIYGYSEFILKPKEQKAAELLYKAQQYFSQDSSKLVLQGDGTSKGVLYIISNYGGTKSASLSKYYAGVSYLKLGEFSKAIEYLKDFHTDAKQVQMVAYGCLGDAYAESGKKDDAFDNYVKAGHAFESDENGSAEYLFRAGLLSETMGKADKAVDLFKEVKEKFPKSEKGSQIDKYIARLSVEKPEL